MRSPAEAYCAAQEMMLRRTTYLVPINGALLLSVGLRALGKEGLRRGRFRRLRKSDAAHGLMASPSKRDTLAMTSNPLKFATLVEG